MELIVDAELSTTNDPYLEDHIYQGERIFPGVMGLEAVAQVVMALHPFSRGARACFQPSASDFDPPQPPLLRGENVVKVPLSKGDLGRSTSLKPNPRENQNPSFIFENIQFNRPVVIPEGKTLTIRLAALVQESGKVEVVLRSEQTAFSVDHFRATLVQSTVNRQQSTVVNLNLESQIPNSLDPQQDIYGEILFHKGRFQRLRRYLHLRATECIAEITPEIPSQWFSRYLPQDLVLGDPGARDATIHALQACIPHTTILPIGIERLVMHQVDDTGTHFVCAKERQRIGDLFIYDLEVVTETGTVLETWLGLQLQIVQPKDSQSPWVAPLLAPYLERRIKEVIPATDLSIVVDYDETVERRVRSDRILLRSQKSEVGANGRSPLQKVYRRVDGKPELSNGQAVSVSHAGDLTIVVAGSEGCDVETVVARNEQVWSDLLGVRRLDLAKVVAQETGEALDVAATRIWCASECLKKAGMVADAPLLLMNHGSPSPNETVWLESGEKAIATFVLSVQEVEEALVFAVLINNEKVKEGDQALEKVVSL